MKSRNIIIGISLGFLTLLNSCDDGILDINPEKNNTSSSFYTSEMQFEQAMMGVYNALQDLETNMLFYMSEVRSDNIFEQSDDTAERDYRIINENRVTSTTVTIENVWNQLYLIIARANEVISNLDKLDDSDLKIQYEAECRFLRGYAYFQLVRFYGEVPITTTVLSTAEAKGLSRMSREEVYAQIEADLLFAGSNLPAYWGAEDLGRATKWAAKGILGKVYLTEYGYPLYDESKLGLAQNVLKEIIDQEGTYVAFANRFSDIFNNSNKNTYCLFEIQFLSGGKSLGATFPMNMLTRVNVPEWCNYTTSFNMGAKLPNELYSMWGENKYNMESDDSLKINIRKIIDERCLATIDTGWIESGGSVYSERQIIKFFPKGDETATAWNDLNCNMPVLRYEDVMLMYAEVLNESGDGDTPVSIINRIRERAGANSVNPIGQENILQAIKDERQLEFVAEGIRWHDLVRWGDAIEVMNDFVDKYVPNALVLTEDDLVYPIPQSEMDLRTGLWNQNSGY